MGVLVKERPKGSGEWWLFINHQGKRKAKKIGKDKRLALEAARKIEAKLILGDAAITEPKPKRVSTFKEYADLWISTTVPATSKPSTITDYQSILKNHVLSAFGNEPVNEISRMDIKTFLMKKSNCGLAASTVGHMKSVMSGVMNLALDDEVIMVNPAQRLGKLFPKKNLEDGIDPLSREELALLLDTFLKKYPEHYPLALTLARTGMRYKEAWALQWGDIDFNGRFITVRRTFSRGHIVSPKSGKSRKVDMSLQLTETLEALKQTRKIQTLKNGWGQVPKWVFVSDKGKIPDGDNWRRRVFKKALEKAGLRDVRIHDLRHTYASLLIQAGESLAYVRDQLGHHSIKITVDIYGHLAPGGNKAAVDRLDEIPDGTTKRNLCATSK